MGQEIKCDTDSDCDPPYEICKSDGICRHKSVFPIEWTEFIGFFLLGGILAMCNSAGVGGGFVIVPLCLILFRFSTTHSVALSNFNIFISSLTRFIYDFRVKHPLKKAVGVNYEIVMIMLPCTLLGALFGVQINQILPVIGIMITLAILLVFMGFKSLSSAIKKFKKENIDRALLKVQQDDSAQLPMIKADTDKEDNEENKSVTEDKTEKQAEGKLPDINLRP